MSSFMDMLMLLMPDLTYSHIPTESSLGDCTIQMSSFMDMSMPPMPGLTYSPIPTKSSLGDHTIQMSSFMDMSMPLERCIHDCVPVCRKQGKVVKSTMLRQSLKDTEWLTKLWCYTAATPLRPPGSPTTCAPLEKMVASSSLLKALHT